MPKLSIEVKVSIPRAGEIVVKVPLEEFTHNYCSSTDSETVKADIAEWVVSKLKVTPLKGEMKRVMKKIKE